jgi:regulator of protease activity HflC (stomatin/prohibitin superfamily)
MMFIKRVKVHSYEKGLLFRDGEFAGLLEAGRHWFIDPLGKLRASVADLRDPWLKHKDLDLIVKTGTLKDKAIVLDLDDRERGLVWIDNRFAGIVIGGPHVLWTSHRKVRVEIVDARQVRFDHRDINVVLKSASAKAQLEEINVAEDHVGVYFRNGQYVETLPAGRYVFWRGIEKVKIFQANMAEMSLDIAGQDVMTADKVTLRLNAVVAYKVKNAELAVRASNDRNQSLYREVQLALRSLIGARDLDALLADKESLTAELVAQVRPRGEELGLDLVSVGLRDVILPGDMKDLLNKVTEAKKAAEANLIVRREETAAMRSQANTAKLLENNPALMRLRELEVLEKISAHAKLNVILGEKGLADKVVNLL